MNLEFVKCMNMALVPRYLFEQTHFTQEQIDRIYEFGQHITASPLCLFYVLTDEAHRIQGMLWATIDVVTGDIHVKLLSVSKKYQSPRSIIIQKTLEFLGSYPFGDRVTGNIVFQTNRPRAYQRAGAEKSQYTLMTFKKRIDQQEQDNEDTIQIQDVSGSRIAV
jgi:hypothetical protein